MTILKLGGRGLDCNYFLHKSSSNSYIVVDAGLGPSFAASMAKFKSIGVDVSRIDRLLVTHEHLDHVNALPQWRNLGVRIGTSAATAQKLAIGHDPTSELYGASIPTMVVDDIFEDGDRIVSGSLRFEAISTPGHSPGSMCYFEHDSATLYAGDTIFANGGIGRFDFPDGHLPTLVESINKLDKFPAKVLCSGHGEDVVGHESCAQNLQWSKQHAAQCLLEF